MAAVYASDPAAGCPKCHGALWDNRTKKTNPKAPDFKCKDKSCDGVIWPPQEPKGSKAAAPAKVASSAGPHIPGIDGPYAETGAPPTPDATLQERLQPLLDAYSICFAHAVELSHANGFTDHAATGSMAATILIAAKDRGFIR